MKPRKLKLGVNGFLVIARMTLDDVPLRFFNTFRQAETFCEDHQGDHGPSTTLEELIEDTALRTGMTLSGTVGLIVVEVALGCPVRQVYDVYFD
jgi:hypothetical protein